jgi:Thioesterase-like superfamily
MADSIFTRTPDGLFAPTEHAGGPWDPRALHGGAPAALIARAFELTEPGADMPIARLQFEFLKPIPFAKLAIETEIVRSGRRVQELAAQLRAGDQLICRAGAVRAKPVPSGLPSAGPAPARSLAGPERGKLTPFSLSGDTGASLATTGMEMSWLQDSWAPGPGQVWMRLRQAILPGEQPSPLARLVATADFGNGVSSELPFDEYLFINADLAIHLWQRPRGEWIGLDSHTYLREGGLGTTESVLHDTSGPVGRAFQTLVVEPRVRDR